RLANKRKGDQDEDAERKKRKGDKNSNSSAFSAVARAGQMQKIRESLCSVMGTVYSSMASLTSLMSWLMSIHTVWCNTRVRLTILSKAVLLMSHLQMFLPQWSSNTLKIPTILKLLTSPT